MEQTWGDDQARPRPETTRWLEERLLQLGASALSEAELLELVLGERTGLSLRELATQSPQELAEQGQLSVGAAVRLIAALETARRAMRSREHRPCLRTPDDIHRRVRPYFLGARRELAWLLCFNASLTLLKEECIATGATDSCHVDPREIFAAALSVRATGFVLVHNHPSGDPEPSTLDLCLTRQLEQGGALLGIRLLDHLILGDNCCTSLGLRGLLNSTSFRHQQLTQEEAGD